MERKRYWWESPFVLAIEGTLTIHILVAVAADALMITHPHVPEPPPPHITLVDVELPKPPPPPPPAPEPPPPAASPPPAPAPRAAPRAAQHVRAAPPSPSPPAETPPPPGTPATPGGAPVMTIPDLGPGTTGVAVAPGPRTTGHVGRGGTGTGLGSGSGAGEVARPVSVATIKQRALPRGDYSYAQTKDYPAEAKQLGIEGQIRVKLVVDASGKVASAVLLNRLGHGLDEMALDRARRIEFEPARDTDDKPVSSVVIWTFDMTLPK